VNAKNKEFRTHHLENNDTLFTSASSCYVRDTEEHFPYNPESGIGSASAPSAKGNSSNGSKLCDINVNRFVKHWENVNKVSLRM
jgi:hypothetical protein